MPIYDLSDTPKTPTGAKLLGVDSSGNLGVFRADEVAKNQPDVITSLTVLDSANDEVPTELTSLAKKLSPFGISYSIAGNPAKDSESNNLYLEMRDIRAGSKSLYGLLFCSDSAGTSKTPGRSPRLFDVPSGMLDNADTLPYQGEAYPDNNYVHPSIAYDATGVAGFKYWMVSSILPAYGTTAAWEDEDVFVSNDATTWQRIRSLYESDKSYTTTSLRLPPNDFGDGARVHGLLPTPGSGEVLEISTPADNGASAIDRVNKTLEAGCFKHDPAILIDGGYVYFYLTYHLSWDGESAGKHRFLVCVRTSDGINWEAVRQDGSTLALDSVSAVRTLFTKDGSDRYNYINYSYNVSRSNPEVIKFGTGDYEIFWGYNFSAKYLGATPYDFDFTTPVTVQDMGGDNHPGLLFDGTSLYQINSLGFYISANRGTSFTKYDHVPYWVGGDSGKQYKKALCIGESGKVIIAEVKRSFVGVFANTIENQYSGTSKYHQLFLTEIASVSALVADATDGLDDGYIDVHVIQTNKTNGTRNMFLLPYVGNRSTTTLVTDPLQKVKLCDLDIVAGDVLQVLVTLNARNGGVVRFGGMQIVDL